MPWAGLTKSLDMPAIAPAMPLLALTFLLAAELPRRRLNREPEDVE